MVGACQSFYVAMEKSLLFHGLSRATLFLLVDHHHSLEIRKKAIGEELFRLTNDFLDYQ